MLQSPQSKALVAFTLVAGTSAFAPSTSFTRSTALSMNAPGKLGAGGMADTRDPEPKNDADPRKSISAAPSFEEYMKQRQQGN